MVLTLGLKEDRLKNIRDEWSLCPICRAASASFVLKGLSDDILCETCESRWATEFYRHWKDELKLVKLIAIRGKTVKGSWLPVESWITLTIKDYERLQVVRGLVKHESKWVTPEEKDALARGLVRYGDEWIAPKEYTERESKRIREFERGEKERLNAMKYTSELTECPRCTKRYNSVWTECPFCRAREIREAQG